MHQHYPVVSLHVNRQLLALRELFWAKGAMEVLDPKMNLFVRFQDVLVKKALATAFKRTFELSLCCVLHKVALQVVLVTAPGSIKGMIKNKLNAASTSFRRLGKQLPPRHILTAFCDSIKMTCCRTFGHTYHMGHSLCLCEFACEVKGFFYS